MSSYSITNPVGRLALTTILFSFQLFLFFLSLSPSPQFEPNVSRSTRSARQQRGLRLGGRTAAESCSHYQTRSGQAMGLKGTEEPNYSILSRREGGESNGASRRQLYGRIGSVSQRTLGARAHQEHLAQHHG